MLRGGLAAIALTIGYVSTTRTLAFTIYKTDAERAYALAPQDGRIAGELAEQIAASNAGKAQQAHAARLARQALIDEPLAVPALTALALNIQRTGDTAGARRILIHSNRLSRRELGTRLWFIENAVARNDIADALRNYDIALRTATPAPDLLFPILSSAVSDPDIAQSLSERIATQHPAWAETFVQYLSSPGTDPIVGAAMLRRLTAAGYAIPATAQASVTNALVAKGALEDAWKFYASFRSSAMRNRSRDPNFAAQLQMPSVFDWTPVMNDAGVNASIQRTRGGGVFEFAAPSTVGGLALQQVQFLPPGRYRMEGVTHKIEQPRAASPYWQLSCLDGRELGRVEVPSSSVANGRFSGELTVGRNDCSAQVLRFILRASTETGGVAGQIDSALLAPIDDR